jgi:serine-type D-Ala-D-Ala carboxypeptidase/endopeptidase
VEILPGNHLDQLLGSAPAGGTPARFSLVAYGADHQLIYRYARNPLPLSEPIAVMSASKWVSAFLILRLVERGVFGLDQKISSLLSEMIPPRYEAITIRQLLNFTSGLAPTSPGALDYNLGFEESCRDLLLTPSAGFPGGQFEYGDSHLHLAGYVAEVATGRKWQELFEQEIAQPLRFTSEPKFFAKPKRRKGLTNPRPGAGLLISAGDYLLFLKMVWNRGRGPLGQLLTPELQAEMEKVQVPGSLLPAENAFANAGIVSGYGLGAWVEEPGGGLVASPGYYGFCPWLDRKAGYYALLQAQEPEPFFFSAIKLMGQVRGHLAELAKK